MRYRRTDERTDLNYRKATFLKTKKKMKIPTGKGASGFCLQKETLHTSVSPIFAAVLVSSVLSPSRCNFVGLKQTNNLETNNNYIEYLKCSEKT